MLYYAFWTIVGSAALFLLAWSFFAVGQRNDFELGAQAERDGLALNVGWSQRMRDGWGHSWRARHGLNDLGEEIRRLK